MNFCASGGCPTLLSSLGLSFSGGIVVFPSKRISEMIPWRPRSNWAPARGGRAARSSRTPIPIRPAPPERGPDAPIGVASAASTRGRGTGFGIACAASAIGRGRLARHPSDSTHDSLPWRRWDLAYVRSHVRSFPDRTDREPPGRRHPRYGRCPSEPGRKYSGERSPAVPGASADPAGEPPGTRPGGSIIPDAIRGATSAPSPCGEMRSGGEIPRAIMNGRRRRHPWHRHRRNPYRRPCDMTCADLVPESKRSRNPGRTNSAKLPAGLCRVARWRRVGR